MRGVDDERVVGGLDVAKKLPHLDVVAQAVVGDRPGDRNRAGHVRPGGKQDRDPPLDREVVARVELSLSDTRGQRNRRDMRAIEERRKRYSFPWQLATIVRLGMIMPFWMYDQISRANSFRE